MDRSCGHGHNELDGIVTRCSRLGCSRKPTGSFAYLGTGMTTEPGWLIDPCCWVHHLTHRRKINAHYEPHSKPVWISGDLIQALAWVHSDHRCVGAPFISVTTPTEMT